MKAGRRYLREDLRRTGAIDRFSVATAFRIFLIGFTVLVAPVHRAGQNDEDGCLEYVGGSVSCEKRLASGREKLESPAGIQHREKVQANSWDRKPIGATVDELILEISELQSRAGREATNGTKNTGNKADRPNEDIREPRSQVAGTLHRTKEAHEEIDSPLEQPGKWNKRRGALRKELQVWQEWWEKSCLKLG